MAIIFFEGFNHDNNEAIKLDSNYWSSPDMASVSFANIGRTNNSVLISNSLLADGLQGNKRLNLSNFTAPLTSENSIGIGFWVNAGTVKPQSRLLSLHNGSSNLLTINIITTTYSSSNDSLALEIIQDGVSKGIYDFKAVVGYNYSISNAWGPWLINSELYLEFYIDAKNNNLIRIRVNGMDMVNTSSSTTTPITGFTNLDTISLYGTHNSWRTESRAYDDFYLTSGSDIENTLLGKDVRIYRLNPESNTNINEWTSNRGWGASQDLASNDGDNSFYFVSDNDKTALFNMNNLPISTGSVGGIKILNTARKVAGNISFVNVYSPANNQPINTVGPTHIIDSNSYKYFNYFLFKNPVNNNDWVINDINNLQLGMKKLS